MLWWLLLLPAGFAAGIMNVLAGGGSFLTLPVLIASGLPVHIANGTNRISVIAQGLFATAKYQKSGEFDVRIFKKLLPPLLVGAATGAYLATQIDPKSLQQTFGVLFLVMSLTLLFRSKLAKGSLETPHPLRYPALFVVGMYGGFIQAGVGLWLLIAATTLFQIPALKANAVKLALTLTFTIPAFVIFWHAGMVAWIPGCILAVSTVLGTIVGVRLSIRGGVNLIWRAVTAVLFVTGVRLLFF